MTRQVSRGGFSQSAKVLKTEEHRVQKKSRTSGRRKQGGENERESQIEKGATEMPSSNRKTR